MANLNNPVDVSAEQRAGDSKADAIAAVLLVAIAVVTAIFWISGH